ncbi:LytTR family DNA-binding domain-containing protein [Bacillus sp. EB600]|uniref:LytR/AlgR family response regulator transcription factor n=1 Tax=Bacillus sp. EB600 TaxID=2806345 RepID=UPI00210BD1F9|nr:LytTR family transcriptional regulator DNA-binding domain-containing protein [Bacillus sp. EB600]MCQ6281505.1 LytTR family transcriptional regulator DNA-binding domain-containing protein [Bacillus sp. EB600]
MLKAFIVDDEPLARDELAYLLKRSKQVEIVGQADSLETALVKLQNLDIDVIFLDIQLGDQSGIDIANKLNELEYPPMIVFATAYDDYALKAFELNAADYLLKPFEEKRVLHTIEKLVKLTSAHEPPIPLASRQNTGLSELSEKIAITVDEKIILVNVNDILYIGTNEGKTIIVTNKEKYVVNDALVTFERKLKCFSIIRVHRAFIVNINGIKEIEPWFNSTYNLVMTNSDKVPVSRTHIKELKQLLGF